MSFITILFLAFSLSADAFAVAVGTGISQKKVHKKEAFSMALTFGIFQGVMPILGFLLATLFTEAITKYDHWIAFALLGYIGGNMIYNGLQHGDKDNIGNDVFAIRSLVVLGIATSIDALAIGVSLTAITNNIVYPAIVIGIVTFITSYLGARFGAKFGKHIGSRAEILGGLILIGIGSSILIEHLTI